MTLRRLDPPSGPFCADRHVPGDKSLSHRALIFAAMAEGTSEVQYLGPGRDVAATRAAIARLGVEIDGNRLVSPGFHGWRPPLGPIDCGNSGTTMRLLAGALAGRPFRSTLTGDASLNRRPMQRLVAPLEALGASVEVSDTGTAPVSVEAPGGLHGAEARIGMASAQVRSAFALAALQADGPSAIESPSGFRDHTERWLVAFGRGRRFSGTRLEIEPGPIPAGRYLLPGDPSSASFLWAAAAITRGAEVVTRDVSLNPGRIGFLQVLQAMGAGVEAEVTRDLGGDPVGDVKVTGQGLFATEVSGEVAVAALDELPLVAVLGAYAEGLTIVRDAGELRAKESDRIASTVALLHSLGAGAEATEDGFVVVGTGWLEAGTVDAADDHRIAMAAAVAATGATGPVQIEGAEAADVSWPGFYDELEALWSSQ
jgi:3-phosphoshikimate 1-carboxyvinyltransferase